MKRFLAAFIAFTLLFSAVACNRNTEETKKKRRSRSDETEDYDETKTTETKKPDPGPTVPIYDPSDVEVVRQFDDYYPNNFSIPWAEANHIEFTNSDVNTYFAQIITSSYSDQQISGAKILNNVGTVCQPTVNITESVIDGYLDYEITYSEFIPLSAQLPDSVNSYGTVYSYHNIGFIDYYTGAILPRVDFSVDVDSSYVYGNVIWKGETYNVSFYEFRESVTLKNETYIDADGNVIWDIDNEIKTTILLTVPKEYDGIIMYVCTANDSDSLFEELDDFHTADFIDSYIFGEEGELVEDHAFFNIFDLGKGKLYQ